MPQKKADQAAGVRYLRLDGGTASAPTAVLRKDFLWAAASRLAVPLKESSPLPPGEGQGEGTRSGTPQKKPIRQPASATFDRTAEPHPHRQQCSERISCGPRRVGSRPALRACCCLPQLRLDGGTASVPQVPLRRAWRTCRDGSRSKARDANPPSRRRYSIFPSSRVKV